MTESEAKAAVERLKADFPVAEAARFTRTDGHHGWCVRTYGKPEFIYRVKDIGAFIVSKITEPRPAFEPDPRD
jgi:hypothetical protein